MLVKMKHFPKFQDFKQPRTDDRASQPKGANLQLNGTNSKINVKYENTKTDLCIPISLQVSRSVSWSGEVKHSITALPSGPGAGRKRLRASTSFLTEVSSPPMTTSGRPLRRQNTACWENEFCLRNLRALSPALFLLFLSERVLLWMFWVGEGRSEELVKLVRSDASSTLNSLRGALGGDHPSTSASHLTWRSGTDFNWGIESTASSPNNSNITCWRMSYCSLSLISTSNITILY